MTCSRQRPGPVIANGGEVLLLIGDAVLAIFPCLTMGAQAAAEAANKATIEAMSALEVLNVARRERDEDAISCGIALHVGDLTYGNIGVPQRLQFTAIGPGSKPGRAH